MHLSVEADQLQLEESVHKGISGLIMCQRRSTTQEMLQNMRYKSCAVCSIGVPNKFEACNACNYSCRVEIIQVAYLNI